MKFSSTQGICIHCRQKQRCVLINQLFRVCGSCIDKGVDIDLLKYKKEAIFTKEYQRLVHEIDLTEKIGAVIEKNKINHEELSQRLGFNILDVIKSAHHITLDMMSDIFFELDHELLLVVIDNQREDSSGQII